MNAAIASAVTVLVCLLFYGFYQAGHKKGRIWAVDRITEAFKARRMVVLPREAVGAGDLPPDAIIN